jgi:predicted lipoprotein with Yx(FWY)xxD motif
MRSKAFRVTTCCSLAVAASMSIFTGVASAARASSGPTTVSLAAGPYGPMLVVGVGPDRGTAVYAISSDYGGKYGCTTTPVHVIGMTIVCTGPSLDRNAEWPALTTTGKPVAGKGVEAAKLGEVARAGIGEQVTYDGHPLYLFDAIPGIPTGEGWDESTIPPWHGVWTLVAPSGNFLAPPETVTTTKTSKGATVLAAVMTTAGGSFAYPVYSFTGGLGCTAQCSAVWFPLLTSGSPGLIGALSRGKFGTLKRADGTMQVTFGGKPLYLDGYEGISLATGFPQPEGNGNGVSVSSPTKGTFRLVTP